MSTHSQFRESKGKKFQLSEGDMPPFTPTPPLQILHMLQIERQEERQEAKLVSGAGDRDLQLLLIKTEERELLQQSVTGDHNCAQKHVFASATQLQKQEGKEALVWVTTTPQLSHCR